MNEQEKESHMTEDTPTRTVELVSQRISAGDVDAALALYEPEAAFTPQPGQVVTGAVAIRPSSHRLNGNST